KTLRLPNFTAKPNPNDFIPGIDSITSGLTLALFKTTGRLRVASSTPPTQRPVNNNISLKKVVEDVEKALEEIWLN
ncbi:MAG: hypothetical protein NDF54_11965, partial [archaeon GB-1867-035]|nr:hypothetical protein [Candidatus Culexmicrobium profundum]